MQEPKCTITDVTFKTNKSDPMFVFFQNGVLHPDNAKEFKCHVYNDEQEERKRVVELSSSNSIVYKGSEPPHNTEICRTLLAIRNKKTNNIRLIEADSVQLAPVLHNDKLTRSVKAVSNKIGFSTLNKTSGSKRIRLIEADSVQLAPVLHNVKLTRSVKAVSNEIGFSTLNKTFGSKRVKRRTELQERIMFDVQTMADQLNEAASRVEIAESDLSMPSVDSLDSLLPCNKLASSVDQVYQLKDIISQSELDSMQEEAERLLENVESCSEDRYSKYFCHYFKILPADNKLQHLKMLLYAECLLKLYGLPSSVLRKKNVCVCPFSEIINSKILSKFTIVTKNRRSRPLSMQDKILCHIIILGILANDFKLNLEPLIMSQKIKGVRVMVLCQVLGLVPSSRASKTFMLKFPLPSVMKSNLKKRKRK